LVDTLHAEVVREPSGPELLTTGEVARVLGVSRQHVVDLCTRGALPCVTVGTHRRIRRSDLDVVLDQRLTREAERSLWLHRAVVGRLVLDPDGVMDRARGNLRRMAVTHPSGMSAAWLACWQQVFQEGVDAVLDTLTSRAPLAVELRQNSPFAGVLTQEQRSAALAAFQAHWRRDHTAA
jgi:excisionase family DNA binding protein